PAGAGALHEHVDLAHAVLGRLAGGVLGGHLRGERRGLAGALEADMAGGGPRDHGAGRVRDGDDRGVAPAPDSALPLPHLLLLLLAAVLLDARAGASLGWHFSGDLLASGGYFLPAFFLPATVFFGPLRVRALVFVR